MCRPSTNQQDQIAESTEWIAVLLPNDRMSSNRGECVKNKTIFSRYTNIVFFTVFGTCSHQIYVNERKYAHSDGESKLRQPHGKWLTLTAKPHISDTHTKTQHQTARFWMMNTKKKCLCRKKGTENLNEYIHMHRSTHLFRIDRSIKWFSQVCSVKPRYFTLYSLSLPLSLSICVLV